jgi:hypothetical protein
MTVSCGRFRTGPRTREVDPSQAGRPRARIFVAPSAAERGTLGAVSTPADPPPMVVFRSPYGGLGLKTKRFTAAWARIEGLLAAAADVVLTKAALVVFEPASPGLTAWRAQPRSLADRDTEEDLAAVVTAVGHRHDEVAAEAWRRFGAPNGVELMRRANGPSWSGWNWLVTGPAAATSFTAWSPFVAAHDQRMVNDYAPAVELQATWTLRLRTAAGDVVADPYPSSQVRAYLRGRHACAFLDLVLPHAAATAAFMADYRAINRAAGMTIPLSGYKLSVAKKRGGGRLYKRLPPP